MIHHCCLRILRVGAANMMTNVTLRHSLVLMNLDLRWQRLHLVRIRNLWWRSRSSFTLDTHTRRLSRKLVCHRGRWQWIVRLTRCCRGCDRRCLRLRDILSMHVWRRNAVRLGIVQSLMNRMARLSWWWL